MSTQFTHTTVLLNATVNALVQPEFRSKVTWAHEVLMPVKASGVYVDGTFGRGGHSRALLGHLAEDAQLFVFDKDPVAIESAYQLQANDKRVRVVHGGFSTMKEALNEQGIYCVQGIMLDLGISSPQIDDASRGFSFMREGPLDMRMDSSCGMSAQQWLATADVKHIQEVIKNYGEERFAFQIAKAIESRRQSSPLCTTRELAELVASVVRTREKGQHPATRTFQAIRIFINEELEELSCALSTVLALLAPKGRLAVISFHSLEDRKVKQFIAKAANPAVEFARLPLRESELPQPLLRNLGKMVASADEIKANPRSRSAMLRVAERTEIAL